jgi:hypothetical protein
MQDQRSRILGVISGVTEWEFFRNYRKKNEGMCRIRDIKDDYFLIVSSMHS